MDGKLGLLYGADSSVPRVVHSFQFNVGLRAQTLDPGFRCSYWESGTAAFRRAAAGRYQPLCRDRQECRPKWPVDTRSESIST